MHRENRFTCRSTTQVALRVISIQFYPPNKLAAELRSPWVMFGN